MNREIEEMALALSEGGCGKECDCIQGDKFNCHLLHSASVLYNAGYRKSTDVAREIFDEIDKISERLRRTIQYGCYLYGRVGNTDSPASVREMGRFEGIERIVKDISELRKKYESEGEDGD